MFERRWTARRLAPVLAATLVAAGMITPAGAALPTGPINRVSPEGGSTEPAIDDSGVVAAYLHSAAGHVMVADLQNGGVSRVVADAGAKEVAISADGSVVAFSTDRKLLGEDGNADLRDIYAVNRDGAGLRLVSMGLPPGSGAFSPTVNVNGSMIAFSAGTLGGSQGPREIWLRDVSAGTTTKVALPAGESCDCVHPSISHDGNAVAFEITGDLADPGGVFVWDRGSGTSSRIAKDASRPSISGNGRAVAYQRDGTVAVSNRDTGAQILAPERGVNPSLSADGNVVAFQATFPLANDGNNRDDVVAFELSSGNLTRVSIKPDGNTGAGGSFQPSINADGSRVVFESDAPDLVGGDGNGATDIFLRLPGDNAPPPPVCCAAGPSPIADDPDVPGAYWLVATDGGIFSFAGLGVTPRFYGSTGSLRLNQPIVGMAPHPTGRGYWFVAADGGVFSFGEAKFFGSTGAIRLNKPIVGMASTPSGNGYWLVATDGGIFSFGDAKFFGSTGAIKLNKPIVGMAATPGGNGYWLVASDGGIFSFGDAKFHGSTGAIRLNKPIVGMAARPQGDGYWLVATDGGIFAFGGAPFKGSTGSIRLNQPIVGMAPTYTGNGYWFVASDGGIFSFGDAGFFGSMGGTKLNKPVVGMAGSR